MKVIVIGTNHAGTAAVRTLKRLDANMEISTYDKSDRISFLGCGIALWVGGEVKDPQKLFYATPEILKSEGINVNMLHEWTGIDIKNKKVMFKNLKTNEEITDSYDKLIIATGSWPIISPSWEGMDLEGVQICKNYYHGEIIKKANDNPKIKNIAIFGAGYIGIELVDAFVKNKKNVSLFDGEDRIMSAYYDAEMTNLLEDEMKNLNVKLHLKEKLIGFKGKSGKLTHVVTNLGEYPADVAIVSVGIKPQTDLLKGIVELDQRGAIVTNNYMQSTNPDIYAIGDCAQVFDKTNNTKHQIALATTAVRTGIIASSNIILGNKMEGMGFVGANAINVFDWKFASVGVSAAAAQRAMIEFEQKLFEDVDRPEFMSTTELVKFKIIWEKVTRKIIGAQVASKNNHTEIMYMFALAIQKGLTIDELPFVDIFFLPHFNKPYNFMTLAALDVLGLNYFKKG